MKHQHRRLHCVTDIGHVETPMTGVDDCVFIT